MSVPALLAAPRTALRRVTNRLTDTAASDSGAVAVIVALLMLVFLGLAAIAVDLARLYVEAERIQRAADAAALAGVINMPQDLPAAQTAARDAAQRNGYTPSGDVVLSAQPGAKPTQLQVSISSRIDSGFAGVFGISDNTVTRSATADFQGAIPMASPCNTFGNEPPGTSYPGAGPVGSSLPSPRYGNCRENPQFWGSIQGPNTDKEFGDQYMTRYCEDGVDGCTGGRNTEFKSEGYFFTIRVNDQAATGDVVVQLYDPAFIATQDSGETACNDLPYTNILWIQNMKDNMNAYTTTDGRSRYDDTDNLFCTGDYALSGPEGRGGTITTSYAVRGPTDTQDPRQAPVLDNCTAQFRGEDSTPSLSQLKQTNQKTRVFHQWVPICTIRNPVKGDYYLQVRTNVALPSGMTSGEYIAGTQAGGTRAANPAVTTQTGDDTNVKGGGTNLFGLRALSLNNNNAKLSVAGLERMPMSASGENQNSQFSLIKALPGAAGKTIEFSVYDAGDEATGTMTIIAPPDATGSIKNTSSVQGCTGKGPINGNLPGCSISVRKSTHNGRIQTVYIPVPSDYNCDYLSPGGCWFAVRMAMSSSIGEDTTTWTSKVLGDPVRLVR